MAENNSQGNDPRPDGGTASQAVTKEAQADYLKTEINILRPATPYMRDHLRIIWTGFIIWVFTTFGPATVTFIATDTMTTEMPGLGFPLHYFLIAIGSPTAALILSAWYARKRDELDRKYGIEHTEEESRKETEAVAADGGVEQ